MKETGFREEDLEEIAMLVRRAQMVMKAAVDDLAGLAEEGLRIAARLKEPVQVVPKVEPERRYISTKELAKRLSISSVTVHRLRKEGLPDVRIGYRVLFDYERVALWVEERNKERKRSGNRE
jgi:excisionase family DNA binding protein